MFTGIPECNIEISVGVIQTLLLRILHQMHTPTPSFSSKFPITFRNKLVACLKKCLDAKRFEVQYQGAKSHCMRVSFKILSLNLQFFRLQPKSIWSFNIANRKGMQCMTALISDLEWDNNAIHNLDQWNCAQESGFRMLCNPARWKIAYSLCNYKTALQNW